MNRHVPIVVSVAAIASGCSQLRPITEAELLAYASAPYERAAYGAPRQVLGVLNNAPVVVDFICSDLCPSSTVRIVRFDLESGVSCADVGGVEKQVLVPVAITATLQAFCFPNVLAQNWSAYVM
jgi:hypothetical protein